MNLLDLPIDVLRTLIRDHSELRDKFALSFCCKRLLGLVSETPLPPGMSWNRRRSIVPFVVASATFRGFVSMLEWLYKLTGKCLFTLVMSLSRQKDPTIRRRTLDWYKEKPNPPPNFGVMVLETAALAKDVEAVKANWHPRMGDEDALAKFFKYCRSSGNVELTTLQAKHSQGSPQTVIRLWRDSREFECDDGSVVRLQNTILDDVAASGNLETANRLVAAGFKFGSLGIAHAIESGSVEMALLAASKTRHPYMPRVDICFAWAKFGSLATASVLPINISKFYPEMAELASSRANRETFDYLYERSLLKPFVGDSAEVCINWTKHNHGVPPAESKMIAFLEHLEKKYKLVLTKGLAALAASEGLFGVLKWIVDNDRPYDHTLCVEGVAKYYEYSLGSKGRRVRVKRARMEEELSKRGIKMARTEVAHPVIQ